MPPLAIAAGVTAAAGIGSSIIGANASKKAANTAAQTARENNATNAALARETRAQNQAVLQPWINIGNNVNPLIAGLLGYGDATQAQKGLETFRGATGYQDMLKEGLGAVNANAATSGLLNSGATLKALQERGNMLASGSFNNYLSNLVGQQGVGASAAKALTGVNDNFAAQIMGGNNYTADVSANAALARAGATNQMLGGIANSIGGLAQSFAGSGSLASPSFDWRGSDALFRTNMGLR